MLFWAPHTDIPGCWEEGWTLYFEVIYKLWQTRDKRIGRKKDPKD
jgi:hypothetical protein